MNTQTQQQQAQQYRQGDLLFIRQETRPDAPLTPRAGTILVEGETTGHAHRLATKQHGAILTTPDGQMWLDITHQTQVVHEEHASVTLDPGVWLVQRQREYSPEAIRTVVD